jgi:hypothetical protein
MDTIWWNILVVKKWPKLKLISKCHVPASKSTSLNSASTILKKEIIIMTNYNQTELRLFVPLVESPAVCFSNESLEVSHQMNIDRQVSFPSTFF